MEAHQLIPVLNMYTMNGVVAANDVTSQTDKFPLLKAALRLPYRLSNGKIIKILEDKEPIDICDAFEPVAYAREDDKSNWSLLVEFDDPDGSRKSIQISLADLQQDPKSVRALLASEGLTIRNRNLFDDMMQGLKPSARVLLARRPGWSPKRDFHVSPDGRVSGPTTEDVRLVGGLLNQLQGGFDEQRDAYRAAAASGASHLFLACCAGVAGTLVNFMDWPETPIFAYVGESSRGKTTALMLAASAFGDPRPGNGQLHSLRSTDNAMEVRAARSNGTFLGCDETANLSDAALQPLLFMINGGCAKGRKSKRGELRDSASWQTFAMLTSEQGIEQKINEGRGVMQTGLAARCMELDVSGAPRLPRSVLDVVESCRSNFGHIGPLVAQHVAENRSPDEMREAVAAKSGMITGDGASPLERRSSMILALLWEAGELLKAVDVFAPDTDVEAVIRAVWAQYRLSTESERLSPTQLAVERLRTALASKRGLDVVGLDEQYPTREPLAWFEDYDGGTRYFVRSDRIISLAGGAFSKNAIGDELQRQGFLEPSSTKNRTHRSLPGGKRQVAHYRLRFEHTFEQ